LLSTEAFLFVFDAALMFIVMVWMNWFHPAEIGLLLRGEQPMTSGLDLIAKKASQKRHIHVGSDTDASTFQLDEARPAVKTSAR
jgi:hypothetical protein